MHKIYELFPDLSRLDRHPGGKLSGGQQQMLTVGRTLMTNPRLLLLDEPVEGLAPLVVKLLGETFRKLNEEENLTILMSEQNVKFALGISDRAYVIDKGTMKYKGTIDELAANEEVKRRYLAV